MATGTANFPNRPFRLRIEVWYNWQSGGRASQHTEVWIDKLSYSPTSSCDPAFYSSFEVYVDSVGRVQQWSGCYNFINGNNFLIHASDHEVNVNVNGDSGAQVYANYDILGYTQTSTFHDGTALSPPAAPTPLGIDQITTTGMRYRFSGNSDGGSPIIEWRAEYGTDPTFGTYTAVPNANTGIVPVSGLVPGTTYYFRSLGRNAIGWGAYSSVVSAATLPSVAPGIAVAPSINGQSSVLTLSPPGGQPGVTEYNIEFRPSGGSTTAYAQTGTTKTFTGLTPGSVYEYRANAEYGSYTSPWTSWTPVSQPNPNTNPGNYFDGNTTDTTELDYVWTAGVDASRSNAMAYGVGGWDATFATTAGVLYQVLGGAVSTHAARVAFLRDATAAGQWHAGTSLNVTSWAEVAVGETYTFSIYVNPSRSQRLAVKAIFHNLSSEVAGTYVGTPVVAPANAWTRISYTVVVPAGGVRAAVRVTDVSGTGFSVMLGGQSILLDGAMISLGSELLPYFDGATPDTQEYVYQWLGLPFYSASSRSVNTAVVVDPLADPDCPPTPLPPTPPTITSECIEEIGSWRRYMVQVLETEVPLWGSTVPTTILETGSVQERQVRIRFYPNPLGLAPNEVDKTTWVSEQIVSFIPANTVITLDGVSERAWAEVEGGEPIAANQLLYGTGGTPAEWPTLECGIGYVVTLDVPTDAPAGNLSTRMLVTQRT